MTYFSTANLMSLADAIYGGPALDGRVAGRLLQAWKLAAPFDVCAVDTPKALPPKLLRAAARVLTLHPGVAYVLKPKDVSALRCALDRIGFAAGATEPCTGAGDLVRAIQQAVLKLRRAQLGAGAATFTTLAEGQARALALQRVRTRTESATEALRAWIDIVMVRHQDRLNTVRRKMIEGICLLTMEQDIAAEMAYPFQVALRRLLDTYSLPALRDAFGHALADIGPFLRAQPSDVSSLFDDAVAFLAKSYARDVGLAQTAQQVGCSPTHLSRLFKQRSGRTLTEHLHAVRCAHVKSLLLETDSPLRVIATKSGFHTPKHFHRVFLKQTGMTPHAFRSAYRS